MFRDDSTEEYLVLGGLCLFRRVHDGNVGPLEARSLELDPSEFLAQEFVERFLLIVVVGHALPLRMLTLADQSDQKC